MRYHSLSTLKSGTDDSNAGFGEEPLEDATRYVRFERPGDRGAEASVTEERRTIYLSTNLPTASSGDRHFPLFHWFRATVHRIRGGCINYSSLVYMLYVG